MRTEANERGRIENGFQQAVDGWHTVKFDEGIDYLMNKDGEIVSNKNGDQMWKLRLIVDDEEDESNGVNVDTVVSENKKGEQMVTDFLGATGQFAAFSKAFPGDVSVFDVNCMNKVKVKLPGQYMRIKTKQNEYKDKKSGEMKTAVNIVGFGKMSDTVEQLEKDLFGDAKGGKKQDKKADKGEGKAAGNAGGDEEW